MRIMPQCTNIMRTRKRELRGADEPHNAQILILTGRTEQGKELIEFAFITATLAGSLWKLRIVRSHIENEINYRQYIAMKS